MSWAGCSREELTAGGQGGQGGRGASRASCAVLSGPDRLGSQPRAAASSRPTDTSASLIHPPAGPAPASGGMSREANSCQAQVAQKLARSLCLNPQLLQLSTIMTASCRTPMALNNGQARPAAGADVIPGRCGAAPGS